jgi:hypothetical protein
MNKKKELIDTGSGEIFVIEKDEYKLFSGPHGRRIVARLNRHKRAFAIAYASLCVSVGLNIWCLYLYISKVLNGL